LGDTHATVSGHIRQASFVFELASTPALFLMGWEEQWVGFGGSFDKKG